MIGRLAAINASLLIILVAHASITPFAHHHLSFSLPFLFRAIGVMAVAGDVGARAISAQLLHRITSSPLPLIHDGAMATELEKRGVELHKLLWSAWALRDDEVGCNAILDIHLDYLRMPASCTDALIHVALQEMVQTQSQPVLTKRQFLASSMLVYLRLKHAY